MIRRLIAALAFISLAVAIIAHLGGHESVAEACGVVAFSALFAAVALPPLGSERHEPA